MSATPFHPARRRAALTTQHGYTLVEMMVAMALGLLLSAAMAYAYVTGKKGFARSNQLSAIQQSVRTAFEYLSSDARMVGHLGCYTGLGTSATAEFGNALAANALGTNYALGIEGYEYKLTGSAYTLASVAPANVTAAAQWQTNSAANGIAAIPVATIAGSASGDGLTPGSDVLVVRTVVGRPVRLAANTVKDATGLSIETMASSPGVCSDGTTSKVSGFCAGGHVLLASCTRARVFQLAATPIRGGTAPAATPLTVGGGATVGSDVYATDTAEVFPLQTVVYYVKRSPGQSSTSLYRRVFDGDPAAGREQELIEGVESLQLLYGVDTTSDPDGIVDRYVAADAVTDWSRVVAIRMGLLVRSTQPIEGDLAAALPTSATVNDATVTYPGTGAKFDRRVFTTTVALRNRVAYF